MPLVLKIFISLLTISRISCDFKTLYNGYKLFKVSIDTDWQLKILRNLETQVPEYIFWKPVTSVGGEAEILVPPHKQNDFNLRVTTYNLKTQELISDLQSVLSDVNRNSTFTAQFDWTRYYPLINIYKFLSRTQKTYPNITKLFDIGKSYEKRPIRGIKISYKPNTPGIFIESNIHAREWITSATATWLINELLTSNDPDVRDIAENITWYIVPVTNPDGYQFTHTQNRLWRKTRKPINKNCTGVDLNRNFGYKWSTAGISKHPCSEVYPGRHPFSEPEAVALTTFFGKISKNITAYLTFHSYSQQLMYPFSNGDTERISNEDEHIKIGEAMVDALYERHGTGYEFGNIIEPDYLASGTSIDWVKKIHKTPLVFIYELRDRGKYGFMLPAEQIIPTAEETLDSLVAMVKEARKLNYFKRK